MKLNLDCMRDTLFCLEDHLSISPELEILDIDIHELKKHLEYPIEEIANMLLVLNEANFIDATYDFAEDAIDYLIVSRITYSGYQLIESIRPKTVWDKTKSICSSVGSHSFNFITQVSSAVLISLLNAQLGF